MKGFFKRQWPMLVSILVWLTNSTVFVIKGSVPLWAYCNAVLAIILAYDAQIIYTELRH